MGICHGISGTHEGDQVVIVASVTKAGGIGGCNPQFGTDMCGGDGLGDSHGIDVASLDQ